MFGQWVFSVAVFVIIVGSLFALGSLQTVFASRQSTVLVGVLILFGLCVFSVQHILSSFIDLGSFG